MIDSIHSTSTSQKDTTSLKADGDYISLGKIGAVYGIKGWLRIQSYAALPEQIISYQPWYLWQNNQWKPTTVIDFKPHGKSFIAKLPGCSDRETAKTYTGKTIAIHREQLPSLANNEYYWRDLEGLTVVTKEGENLGKSTQLFDTGSNDVLVVQGEHEYLIPYLWGKNILAIDLEKQTITIDWDVSLYSGSS